MPSLLSQKAVLASVSISQWSARKLDKKATEEIHARNHAEPHAGRYNKLLIAREDAMGPATRVWHHRCSHDNRWSAP
jgi:hypothetical protein